MNIQSTRFGEIAILEDFVIRFPEGLPGFSEEKEFAFIKSSPQSPFAYLQSVNEPNLTFVVVDPFAVFDHYSFEQDDDLMQQIGVTTDNPPEVFCIVKIPKKFEEMTANLTAPLIVNWKDRVATQIVLTNSPYSMTQRLFPYGLPSKAVNEDK